MARETLSMNTHNFAPGQFSDYQSNSACLFQGALLFATSDGLFAAGGGNDGYDGETPIDIDAYIVLPTSDFGYRGQKTPRSMLLGGRFDGQMQVSITDEQGVTRDYPTPYLGGADGVKIALRSDQRSRYFSVKIANVDGADFALDSADLVFIPVPERRR